MKSSCFPRWCGVIALSTASVFATIVADEGVATARRKPRFDYQARIGVAETNSKNSFCINTDKPLSAGTKVLVIWAYGRQSFTDAVVGPALPGGCAMHVDSAQYSYALTRTAGAMPEGANGIAIINPARRAWVRRGRAQIDLDGDGRLEEFRICTSQEGLHFTVWTGAPLRGVRRWHQYYSLGYDTVPSCNPKDYKGTS